MSEMNGVDPINRFYLCFGCFGRPVLRVSTGGGVCRALTCAREQPPWVVHEQQRGTGAPSGERRDRDPQHICVLQYSNGFTVEVDGQKHYFKFSDNRKKATEELFFFFFFFFLVAFSSNQVRVPPTRAALGRFFVGTKTGFILIVYPIRFPSFKRPSRHPCHSHP